MFTERLINELGLLKLQAKSSPAPAAILQPKNIEQPAVSPAKTQASSDQSDELTIDKTEFRLLVKMLQAIDHDCVYELIGQTDNQLTYQHPKIKLVFADINTPDTAGQMHLSSLADLLQQPTLKRTTWEKLKTLIPPT